MKKRVIGLLLSIILVFGLIGCGKSAEPKQEETEQEEEIVNTEQEFSNDDIVIKVEDTTSKYILRELEYEDAEGSITPESDVPIYCEDGYQIGHIKAGATIDIKEHGLNSTWYRFPNPINGTQYDYIFVGSMDIDMDHIYCESYSSVYVSEEEPVAAVSEEYTEQEKLYNEAIALFDENKTYTYEEFCTLMQDAANLIGVEFSDDVADKAAHRAQYSLNLSSEELKDRYDELVLIMIYGLTGNNKMDMCFRFTEPNVDTSGEFEIYVFLGYHQE